MKVETKPVERKPEVVITLSWEEATILRMVCGGVGGGGKGRNFTTRLWRDLANLPIPHNFDFEFHGRFGERAEDDR